MNRRAHLGFLIRLLNLKKICEVGVLAGSHLKFMVNEDIDLCVGIDVWGLYPTNIKMYDQKLWKKESFYNRLLRWEKKQSFEVQLIRDFSHNAVEKFENNYFDYIYLDADHSYEATWSDMQRWWPKVKSGGILGGHDYNQGFIDEYGYKYGVYEAVHSFINQHKDKIILMHVIKEEPASSFYIIKR